MQLEPFARWHPPRGMNVRANDSQGSAQYSPHPGSHTALCRLVECNILHSPHTPVISVGLSSLSGCGDLYQVVGIMSRNWMRMACLGRNEWSASKLCQLSRPQHLVTITHGTSLSSLSVLIRQTYITASTTFEHSHAVEPSSVPELTASNRLRRVIE
jgi:hypothetical protein